jgi:hypothetical protein
LKGRVVKRIAITGRSRMPLKEEDVSKNAENALPHTQVISQNEEKG